MKYREYTNVAKNFRAGDTAWACAFHYTHDKESKSLHQEPIYGKFMIGNTQLKVDEKLERRPDYSYPEYFVPFKKNGVDLAWSKAVHMSSRHYATTEDECVELYNSLIMDAVDWHRKEIDKLEKLLLA